jgi:hypothetical protein
MRKPIAILTAAAALLACGGGDALLPSTAMFVSLGSLQCSGGGTTLPALQADLEAAGVRVLASSCGSDGLPRLTICGVGDGRIAIFEIAQTDEDAATALGYAPLSLLPEATAGPC